MEQKLEPLNGRDLLRLEKMRLWVGDHYDNEARDRFEPPEGKIFLIQTILNNRWIKADETWKLQSLGVAFGDALGQYLGLEWVAVEDDDGRDPALRDPLTPVVVFPLTMISKRIERREVVDVSQLLRMAVESVSEQRHRLPGGGRN